MSMGTPIVASNRTSIPEVVGDAGSIVDPENAEEIVSALAGLLSSPRLRDSSIARGKARAKRFDGIVTASRMIDVYAAAAAPRRVPWKQSR
jgi:glycosyltransferase involved in cell wall biosynthesis